jgi:hypothetical protein
MPRPIIAWSYSGLTNFEGCPRRFWATKIGKVVSDVNQYNLKGDEEHQSLQLRLTHNMPLHRNLAPLEPLMQKLAAAPGQQYVERKLTLRQDYVPCRGDDWNNAWVRGAADWVKIYNVNGIYIDWKSGKPRNDFEDQINLTALLLFEHFPALQTLKGSMLYYRHNKLTPPHTVTRADAPLLWNGYISRVKELEQAKINDNWPTNPSPLCGWCPYKACPFNKMDERLATEAQGLKWKFSQ